MNVQRGGCESRMTKKICLVEGCRECPFFKKGKQYAETPVNIDYYHHCDKSGAYHETIEGLWKTCPLPDMNLNERNYVQVPKLKDMIKLDDHVSIINNDHNITKCSDDKHPPKSINWGG